jgi:cysteine desulfurase/selenocysteine lyase
MSTPESTGPWDPTTSQELRVASSVLPTPGSAPTVNTPSPGIGLGVLRDPVSLPWTQQLDPVAFAQTLALGATKLFTAAPQGSEGGLGMPAGPQPPGFVTSSVPAFSPAGGGFAPNAVSPAPSASGSSLPNAAALPNAAPPGYAPPGYGNGYPAASGGGVGPARGGLPGVVGLTFGPPPVSDLQLAPTPVGQVPTTTSPVPNNPVPNNPVPTNPVPNNPVSTNKVAANPAARQYPSQDTARFAPAPNTANLPVGPSVSPDEVTLGRAPRGSAPATASDGKVNHSVSPSSSVHPNYSNVASNSGVPTSYGPARTQEPHGAPNAPDLPLDHVNPFDVEPNLEVLDALLVNAPFSLVRDLPNAALVTPFLGEEPVSHGSIPLRDTNVRAFHVPDAFQAAVPVPLSSQGLFDPYSIREEFPILRERVNGKPLVWLDNAATTQKPREVIQRISTFYERENSNIHRAAHTLAARSTDAYEKARETVRSFIGAPSVENIVFVRGATEGINLVAQTFGRRHIGAGDEIVITWLEHHANIVPWQLLCAEVGAHLRVAPVDDDGQVILSEYERLLSPRTKLVAFTQVSNALGTITPAHDMIEIAHRYGAKVLLDGAQGISHTPVNVQALDCDFYVFSGHKVFAPTGIGVVYGKQELLDSLPPWQGGGNMIQDVTHERTLFHKAPARFEAGTGNIADAVGLGAALEWLTRVGIHNVERYEHELLEYATSQLVAVPGLRLLGTAPNKAGVLSFTLAGQKTENVGGLLDQEGIAVRSGHHCAQPILRRFGVEATVRASLAPYNTREDIDALVAALYRLQRGLTN